MGKFKVELNGIDTSRLKHLTNKEMNILFEKMKKGDKQAKEDIINGNLKLVLSLITKYKNKNIDLNDLFQVGCVGLIKAVDNFDIKYNVMFSTYAVPLILGEIKRLVRCNTPLRVARSIKDTSYKILKYKEEYNILYGINPTIKEISKHLNIKEYEINEAILSLEMPLSINKPIYNDGGDTIYLIDQLKDKEKNLDISIDIKNALEKLKDKEREVLIDRYIIGKTQNEIAKLLNISQAQVSRIEKSAIKQMRNNII